MRETPPAKSAIPGDERRLVTILFVDLAGFTTFTESRDPEEVQELLNECFDALVPCVQRYGGVIDKFMGDALMALFGAPVAHENDAERAIRAALEVRRALETFSMERGLPLAVHQGIGTGRVLAGSVGGGDRHDYSVIGDAVNVASRLEDLSAPGEILIAADTYALAGSLFDTEDGGSVTVRGRAEPLRVYRVLGEARPDKADISSRRDAPLVGRESELRGIREALTRLSKGEGGVIYIAGDAGVGKTRLLEEARRGAEWARWLEGQAASIGPNASYQPVRQILEADIGWSTGDDREERLGKLARRVEALLPDECQQTLRFLAALLGVATAEQTDWLAALEEPVLRRRLHGSISRYLARLAHEQPLALVFEDLHWVDASTATFIEELTPLVHDVPLLLFLASRPDVQASSFRPDRIASRARDRFFSLELVPLDRERSRKLIATLLDSTRVPPGLNHLVETRAEGNPFFIREILRSLIDSQALDKDGAGVWRLARSPGFGVPDTVQGVIASRADRLPPEAKELIRVASVIGRTFRRTLLADVVALPASRAEEQMRYLETVEMIRVKPGEQETEAAFAHALVQEGVYESIPLRERRLLHRRVAQTIEAESAEASSRPDLVAYHYGKAERWNEAQHHFFRAAERARIGGARETNEYYRQAFEALLRGWDRHTEGQRADESLEWFVTGILPLLYTQRLPHIGDALREFCTRVAATFGPSDHRALTALEMQAALRMQQSEEPQAIIPILEMTIKAREAADGQDNRGLVRPLLLIGACQWTGGDHRKGEKALLRAIRIERLADDPDAETLVALYGSLGGCYGTQAEYWKAKTVMEEALAIAGADRTCHYAGLLSNLCENCIQLGLAKEAEQYGRLGSESADVYHAAYCRSNLAYALRMFGKYCDALAECERAAEVFEELERSWELGYTLVDLAECQLQLGDADTAAKTVEQAIDLLKPFVHGHIAAGGFGRGLWVLAGVELARGNTCEAERLLKNAAQYTASEYPAGDQIFEADILFRRAQLRLRQGRRDQAEEDIARAAQLLCEVGGEKHGRRSLLLYEWEQIIAAEAPARRGA